MLPHGSSSLNGKLTDELGQSRDLAGLAGPGRPSLSRVMSQHGVLLNAEPCAQGATEVGRPNAHSAPARGRDPERHAPVANDEAVLHLGAVPYTPAARRHREASASKASVRSRISQAQYVVEMTDCIKHDAATILCELEGVLPFRWVRTKGGTTRILRDLLAFVEKQPA